MEQGESSNGTQPPLIDTILQNGQLAFNPELPENIRKLNKTKFDALMESTGTLALLPVLNLLVQPGRTHPWLRAPLISSLATLPLRERGVQTAIEFVLSVHPSSAGYNTTANAGKRSGITHEALDAVSKLLSSPPSSMSPEDWFGGIAPQLFALLQGEGEPEMDRAAAYVIGFGILGRRQYGAPGAPGWKAFVEPIFRYLDPSLVSPVDSSPVHNEEDIIALGASKVLASSLDVSISLKRMIALITTHPNPAMTKRLLSPILLPLWSLSSWDSGGEYIEQNYCNPAKRLLSIFLQLSSFSTKAESIVKQPAPAQNLQRIVQNLMFKGRSDPAQIRWIYISSQDGGIQIQERLTRKEDSITSEGGLIVIDHATTYFVTLIKPLIELEPEISQLFMILCRKWLSNEETAEVGAVLTRAGPSLEDNGMEYRLIEAQVMQKMITLIPGKLVDDSQQVLELVDQVLANFIRHRSDSTEETLPIALSLLNLVLTSSNFRTTPSTKEIMNSVETSLGSISMRADLDLSTIQNMLLLLRFRRTADEPGDSISDITDQRSEDRKSYGLAMSYLTSIDSPPPVRVQGLELVSGLVKNTSSVLDIPALLILFASLLQDSDEYIYLRVIKSLTELSRKHPKAVVQDLVDRYVDPHEDADLDQRLRFGEALLQVIQASTASFSGDTAQSVCEGLLSIAGRRGYRPKTEQEQGRRNKLKRKKDQDAQEAWGGDVPQFEDNPTPENEILAQIVSGWESQRGTEDVRIRASALSILGSAIETNIAGIQSAVISATVDLSIHILTLEPEPEKGILRRSAILLIMSFVRALDEARTEGIKLGFGFVGQSLNDVQRILKFVEATDNDELVRQHARDVVEGLETWQTNSLLPPRGEQTEIQKLAGLSINPLRGNLDTRMRPRIEEIE